MKLNTIVSIVICIAVICGCKKDFLSVENPNQATLTSFYKTRIDFELAVNACYSSLALQGLYGNNMLTLFGSQSDKVINEKTVFGNFAYGTDDGNVIHTYEDLYKGVARSNVLLDKIESWNPASEDDNLFKKNAIAQAKFVRGLCYFYLATLFNTPPLTLHYIISYEDQPDNLVNAGSQNDIYNQVIADLKDAVPNLPESWSDNELGRATSYAALSMLGKTYLYMGNFKQARNTFDQVIKSGKFSLIQPLLSLDSASIVNAYLCNFSYKNINSYKAENNSESVFEIQFSDEYSKNNFLPGWQCSGNLFEVYNGPQSYKNMVPIKDVVNSYDDAVGLPMKKDPRFYANVWRPGDLMAINADDPYYESHDSMVSKNGRRVFTPGKDNQSQLGTLGVKKYYFPVYSGASGDYNSPRNYRAIRYSDVLLMYAEACLLSSDSTNAALTGLEALNAVRNRVKMPPYSVLNPANIIHERDVEFMFEEFRIFDVIRWKRINSKYAGWEQFKTLNWYKKDFIDGKNEFLPIPVSEINKGNGRLLQNPGW